MKAVIIYQSKYGSTGQYAQWLASALGFPMLELADATSSAIANYDVVVFGTPVYVGSLLIAKWLDQNAGLLAEKKVLLFIVSGTTTDDPVQQQKVIDQNLGRGLRRSVSIFFLPGRCNIQQLSWRDRVLLKIGAWLEKDPGNKALMKAGFNKMDVKKLDPLVAKIQKLMNSNNKLRQQEYAGTT